MSAPIGAILCQLASVVCAPWRYAGAVRERLWAYSVIVAIVGAVLWPLLLHPRFEDSFPLSNYPMFSRGKRTPTIHLRYAVAVDASGARRHVPPPLVANGEVLQARAVFDRAVNGGTKTSRALCEEIARKVASAGGAWSNTVAVEVVSGTHNAVRYLAGDTNSGKEKVHARCATARGS